MSFSELISRYLPWLSKLPQQRIAQGLSALLVIALAYLCAQLTWLTLAPEQSTVVVVSKNKVSNSAQVQNFNLNSFLQLKLFGDAKAKPVTKPVVEQQDAPETRLNLQLVGVVASSTPEQGNAIITNNGEQNTYGVGEQIKGTRASLYQVYADRVLIKQAGRLETLMLEGFKYKKLSDVFAQKDDNQPEPVTPDALIQAQREISQDPNKLSDYITIAPARSEGKLIGYQLMPGKDSQLFKASGLRPGDIAVGLNGLDLTEPRQAAQALRILREEQQITLTIDRDGQQSDIDFALRN